MNKWIFILGRHPALSFAELSVLLKQRAFSFNVIFCGEKAAVIESKDKINPDDLMNYLGGTIKIGKLLGETKIKLTSEVVLEHLTPLAKMNEGKFSFGFSLYGASLPNKEAIVCKRALSARGISARFVEAKESVLNAAQVKKYKMDGGGGAEMLFIKSDDKIFIGHTVTIQSFDKFSDRDYGRPSRDVKSGMIPPKLARMMINLSGCLGDGLLIDPFCGSGTILAEAALMGFKNIIGSDISKKAVKDARENINWALGDSSNNHISIEEHDATQIHNKFKKPAVDAIVTEPYLGPPLQGNETLKGLEVVQKELANLYVNALRSFRKIIKPDGRVVIIVPAFKTHAGWLSVLDKKQIKDAGWIINEPLDKKTFLKLQKEEPLLHAFWYCRPDQKLARQVLVLEPKD